MPFRVLRLTESESEVVEDGDSLELELRSWRRMSSFSRESSLSLELPLEEVEAPLLGTVDAFRLFNRLNGPMGERWPASSRKPATIYTNGVPIAEKTRRSP